MRKLDALAGEKPFSVIRHFIVFTFLIGMLVSYQCVIGRASTTSAAKSAYVFSQIAASHWRLMANTLDVSLTNTEVGQLMPVVTSDRTALDLIVYGSEVVEVAYKKAFKSINIDNMTDQVFVYVNRANQLSYAVAGMDVIGLEATQEGHVAVFFNHANPQVIRAANKMYDQSVISLGGNSEGTVKHIKTKDGQYILGFYHL